MIAYAGKNSGIPSGLLVGLTLTAALTIANLCFFFQPLAALLQTDFNISDVYG